MAALNLLDEASRIIEPKSKSRWFLAMHQIPTDGAETGPNDLAFAASTAARPGMTFNQIETHRLNDKFYWAGKPTWNELPMTFYDFINEANSVSQILWKWKDKIHDPVSGQMGFKRNYSAPSAMLAMLTPEMEVAEKWFLFNIWPTNLDGQELSYEDDGIAMMSVTFRYDYALHEDEDVKTPDSIANTNAETAAIETPEAPPEQN